MSWNRVAARNKPWWRRETGAKVTVRLQRQHSENQWFILRISCSYRRSWYCIRIAENPTWFSKLDLWGHRVQVVWWSCTYIQVFWSISGSPDGLHSRLWRVLTGRASNHEFTAGLWTLYGYRDLNEFLSARWTNEVDNEWQSNSNRIDSYQENNLRKQLTRQWYTFFSFCKGTALKPAVCYVISRWAKPRQYFCMCMCEWVCMNGRDSFVGISIVTLSYQTTPF